jgi:hypothetical protein
MGKRKRIGECAYCGKVEILTRDHIPPKSLFPGFKRQNLISVPCCQDCNQNASKDDEYFRLFLTTRWGSYNQLDVREIWQKVLRSLQKPEAEGFAESFKQSLRPANVVTEQGVLLPTGIFYVESRRIREEIKRITKGLYYYENKTRLLDGYEVKAIAGEEVLQFDKEFVDSLLTNIFPIIRANPQRSFGKGLFTYRFAQADLDSPSSVWLMSFYRNAYFLSWIFPEKLVS